jgi:hypothetical protein
MSNSSISKKNKKMYKVGYFETTDGRIVLPASLTKRIFGRLIDILLGTIIGLSI